jgi:hypothetical protein
MYAFALAAAGIAVLLLVVGAQRPRVAIFIAAILWGLYAVYEFYVASGVLCEKDCNIRVDLVFFLPTLALATFCARQSYMGRPAGQAKIIGTVLGAIGLFAGGLWAEDRGYGGPAYVVMALAALAFVVYHYKSKAKSRAAASE